MQGISQEKHLQVSPTSGRQFRTEDFNQQIGDQQVVSTLEKPN